MRKEEGVYTIKRVESLPKKGNANYMYLLKGEVEKFYRWDQHYYEEIIVAEASSGGGSEPIPNVQDFRTNFVAGGFGSTVEVYQDGVLTDTLTSDSQDFTLDLNKSTAFAVGGLSPDIELENSAGTRFDATILPIMSGTDWYEQLGDVAGNGYATLYLSDVS